jgi:putative ABC transport system substrate-binding protein
MNPRAAALNVTLALVLLAVPVHSPGQQPAKVYRIGYLAVGPAPTEQTPQYCPIKGGSSGRAWVEGLREHGYIEGQNLLIECRWTEGHEERAPVLAAELVSLKPDLLVAFGTVQVRAAKQATTEIPIVMVGVIEPVRRGLVTSLAHPGGNVTGPTNTVGMEIEGKRLQLLKEAVPKLSRVAVLHYFSAGPPDPNHPFQREEEAAAQTLGLTLRFYEVRDPNELAGAFAAMAKAREEALYVVPNPFWGGHEQRIADLAVQSRLPTVSGDRDIVQAGGLLSYYANIPAIRRRVAFYVDKILHGANPGDLPVEQPTKFDLIINLKTAKALGLTIPQSLLNRADEVIQ